MGLCNWQRVAGSACQAHGDTAQGLQGEMPARWQDHGWDEVFQVILDLNDVEIRGAFSQITTITTSDPQPKKRKSFPERRPMLVALSR